MIRLKRYSGAGIGLDNYSNNWYYYDGVGAVFGTTSVGVGAWTKLTVVYDGSQAQLYRDGNAEGAAQSVNDVNINLVNIGRTSNGYGPLDGKMDEVRISSTARSADWIKASYLSESDGLRTRDQPVRRDRMVFLLLNEVILSSIIVPEGKAGDKAVQKEKRDAEQALRLAKELERKKAYLAREQAIDKASQSKQSERAEKRATEEGAQLARDEARRKAYSARETAMAEARESKKLRDKKQTPR